MSVSDNDRFARVQRLKRYADSEGCTLSDLAKRSHVVRAFNSNSSKKYNYMASKHSDAAIQAMPWNR